MACLQVCLFALAVLCFAGDASARVLDTTKVHLIELLTESIKRSGGLEFNSTGS